MPTTTAAGLDVLRRAYADRLQAARSATTGVVGLVGNTIPRELVMSLGRLPLLVAADPAVATPTADVYMEPVIPPETKVLFEMAVGGAFESFDLLVLSRPYTQLYYYLKEVHRLGRAALLPPLHMFDLMQSRRHAVRVYNWRQFQALTQRLERASGSSITDAALRAAVQRTDSIRALQRQLLSLRWHGRVSGSDAMQAIGAGYFMEPRQYRDALAACIQELEQRPRREGARLVVLPSEPLSHLHLHDALETTGATVVAEDDWWGARAPGDDVPLAASFAEAIFQKYWLDTHSTGVWPAHAREAWFHEQAARPETDGVVFYLPPSDHQLGWDYPRLKAWVDGIGKPSLLVREDAAQPAGRAAIAARVADWIRE